MGRKRGAAAASVILGGAAIGWNSYYFREALSALVLFALVCLPLVTLALVLVLAEAARERGMAWVRERAMPAVGSAGRRLRHRRHAT